jgi:formylglycine-generating enzyme required for sulfatase activity
MKKNLCMPLIGCVAFAAACFAQDPDLYAVVDLSGGYSALSYPVSYTNAPPVGGWTLADKTDKLVLRKIPVAPPNSFYIGVFELTTGQYTNLVGAPGVAGSALPFANSTPTTVQDYLLDPLSSKTGEAFTFPSEAQWETAYRAGSTNDYYYDSDDASRLTNYAWYVDNAAGNAHPVGGKPPNGWGLYDMAGNVAEYCTGAGSKARGGSYLSAAADCRFNVSGTFVNTTPYSGFRLCMSIPITPHALTVTGGTGGGSYTYGTSVPVAATNDPAVETFVEWLVTADNPTPDLGAGFIATNASTTVTMNQYDVTLTASNTPTLYTLIVTNDTGTGSSEVHPYGEVVSISAVNPSPATHTFDRWTGDTNTVANIFADSTTVTVTNDLTITATFTPIPFVLSLYLASETYVTNYAAGDTVSIDAGTPPEYHMFDIWTVVPADADLGALFNAASPTNSLVMPATNVQLTATFRLRPYPLTVISGSGSGDYVKDATPTINAAAPPSAGHVFDCWTNATGGTVANLSASSTTFTMTGGPASVTAAYKSVAVQQKTYMVVNLDDGSQPEYLDVPPAGGWTDAYKTNRMVFRKVATGSFQMGSPSTEAGRNANETRHPVTLTRDFYLGLFEVTQAQWKTLEGDNPSYYSASGNAPTYPVEQVSYEDIRGEHTVANWPSVQTPASGSFIGRLRNRAGLSTADLPTEAQWEYACRAGTTTPYAGDLASMAWYAGNSGAGTHAVGTKAPNAWDLYDMHGNVEEICLDWYSDAFATSAQTDPTGNATPNPGTTLTTLPRVFRGGSYISAAEAARSAHRAWIPVTNYVTAIQFVTNAYSRIGFRVAVPQTTASYLLTVVNSAMNTGGVFAAGTAIGMTPAPAPAGQKFAAWQVSPSGLDLGAGFSATTAQTLLTMPTANVTITAIYIPDASTGIFRFQQLNPGGATEQWIADGTAFTLAAPAPQAGYRFDRWTVSPATANLGAGFAVSNATTTVLMPAHDVAVTPTYVLNIPEFPPLTPPTGITFTLDAGEGQRPATFSAKGLPAGLKIDKTTGVISGIPTRAGTYTVQVAAKHTDGSTITYSVSFVVQTLPATAQGTFTGYIYVGDEIKGLLTYKVTSAGRLSASLAMQAATYSFSGKAWDSMTAAGLFNVLLTTRQGEQLALTVDGTDGSLAATLSGGRLGAQTFDVVGQRNAFLDKNNAAAQTELARYLGYYTVALPIDAIETTPAIDNMQSGSGYLTATVGARGAVKIAGKLADGTRISGATTLVIDGGQAYIPLFVKLYARRGLFAGLLQLSGTGVPALEVSAVNTIKCEWFYPGKSKQKVADAFYASLAAYGAYYNKQANIQTEYTGASLQIDDFGWTLPLIPGSGGSLVVAANPDKIILKAVRQTGIFSGSFKTLNPGTGRTVTLRHAGVLTLQNGDYVGDGAYVESRKVDSYTLKSSHRVKIAQ